MAQIPIQPQPPQDASFYSSPAVRTLIDLLNGRGWKAFQNFIPPWMKWATDKMGATDNRGGDHRGLEFDGQAGVGIRRRPWRQLQVSHVRVRCDWRSRY